MFSQPWSTNRSSTRRHLFRRLGVVALFVGQPGVRPARDARTPTIAARLRRWSVMNSGPVEQFSPTRQQVGVHQRRRQRLDATAPRASCPSARSSPRPSPARGAQLANSRSMPISAGLDRARVVLRLERAARRRRRRAARAPGRGRSPISSSKVTPPVTEIAFVVGPMVAGDEPRPLRRARELAATRRASRAAASLISASVSCSPYSASTMRRAAERVRRDDVRARRPGTRDGRRRSHPGASALSCSGQPS